MSHAMMMAAVMKKQDEAASPQNGVSDEVQHQWQALNTALNNSADFVYAFDLTGRFTYANLPLLALWRKSFSEAMGKNFFELGYPPELADRLQRQIQQVIETQGMIRDQTPFAGPGGESRYYEYIFAPVLSPDGKTTAVVGSTRDVTERRQAEEALLESERQFRTLAESIPNLAWMAAENGDIFWYNRRWYEYTGKSQEEMKGWGWQTVHDPAVLPRVMDQWTSSIATGREFEMVFPLRGADGGFRSFLTRVEPVKDSHGRVVRWFGTNTDVNRQMMMEEELRRKNRELEEFAYVASHDLQEPLRMVNIYTQLILRHCDPENEKVKQYAGFVQGGVGRMVALLRDLLTFSRAVHEEEIPVGTVDLNQSLEEARIDLNTRIEETNATITTEALPRVRGETQQLAHVFQNLLSNALKYRREGVPPVIGISAVRVDGKWVISVKDNGIGFEPQYAAQIFGLFKRLHKDAYEGTGLGLAICKRIIERFGGEIWAEGKLGEGAVFHFSLDEG